MEQDVIKHARVITSEMKAMFDRETHPVRKRPKKLRSSSLPYCPLRDLYETHVRKQETDSYEDRDTLKLDNLYYFDFGTNIHELIQNTLPKTAGRIQIWGRWKPTGECECTDKCPYKDNEFAKLGPKGCKECGGFPEYEELEFIDGKWTSHMDALIRIKGTKTFYLLDYKTCNSRMIDTYQKYGRGLPKKPHVFQVGSYGIYLKKFLKDKGYEYGGAFLIYTTRDTPSRFKAVYAGNIDLKDLNKKLKKAAKGFKAVSKAIKKEDLGAAKEACVRNKLCDDMPYYNKHIEDKYKPCPLADVCFNPKKLEKKLKEI